MPLSGGTSGAHDDSMHQGSAKRDVADGLAGLNGNGMVLGSGNGVSLRRDVGNNIYLVDRDPIAYFGRFNRVSGSDYIFDILVAGAYKTMQHAGFKDVVNGIAALDAAGALLLPGSKMYFTRDGSDDVHIYERTSDEEAYAFHRVGADDYTFFVKESNVWKRMQTESMKDAANGIAGLDANILLDPVVYAVSLEEYSNHLGAVDNFTQTGTAGNGTATEDGANHEMDLDSGVTIVGHARFESKKVFTLASQPIIMNFIPQNIVGGAGNIRNSSFGLDVDWSTANHTNEVKFEQVSAGTWRCAVCAVGACTFSGTITLVNGDLCTIVVTSSKVQFFVNKVLQFTSTTNIPTASMYFGAGVQNGGAGVSTARTLSVDMMSLKRYV